MPEYMNPLASLPRTHFPSSKIASPAISPVSYFLAMVLSSLTQHCFLLPWP
jgi:hypothetical protein